MKIKIIYISDWIEDLYALECLTVVNILFGKHVS